MHTNTMNEFKNIFIWHNNYNV